VTARGRCACGAIAFEATGTPSVVCLCHCSQCRRSVGATPVAWATFARDDFRLVRGTPRWFASSAGARRAFCGDCGSSLFFEATSSPDEIDVTVATLDGESADRLGPDRHIWVPSKLAWARTDDGRACHVRDSGSATMAPRG
jgi:hypothetical protein